MGVMSDVMEVSDRRAVSDVMTVSDKGAMSDVMGWSDMGAVNDGLGAACILGNERRLRGCRSCSRSRSSIGAHLLVQSAKLLDGEVLQGHCRGSRKIVVHRGELICEALRELAVKRNRRLSSRGVERTSETVDLQTGKHPLRTTNGRRPSQRRRGGTDNRLRVGNINVCRVFAFGDRGGRRMSDSCGLGRALIVCRDLLVVNDCTGHAALGDERRRNVVDHWRLLALNEDAGPNAVWRE
jgi:hypothetical protein